MVKEQRVSDYMIPVENYASVRDYSSLLDAITALEEYQTKVPGHLQPIRSILILDEKKRIVGKIGHLGILKALEPKYGEMLENVSHTGFSADFLKSMLDRYSLWGGSLIDICRKAAGINVKSFMHTLGSGEYISENATIDEAIHYLVMGHHHSLLVVGDKNTITGILRLTDLFEEVFDQMKNVEI